LTSGTQLFGCPSRSSTARALDRGLDVTAGIHGAEYVSIAALREVVLGLDPSLSLARWSPC
jgi:hypothetical protein